MLIPLYLPPQVRLVDLCLMAKRAGARLRSRGFNLFLEVLP